KRADDRARVCRKGCCPLLPVLCVPPAGRMRADVGLAAFVEGHRLSALDRLGGKLRLAMLDRVDPIEEEEPALARLRPSLVEAHRADRTEPHVAVPRPARGRARPEPAEPEHPAF